MTKAEIDAILDRVRSWPHERQEDLISIVEELERKATDVYDLSEEDEQALDEAELSGDASEEEVEVVLGRFRQPR